MRIKAIAADNFLSFGREFLLEFNDKVTFLVGPNSGGKTNVLRLIKFFLERCLANSNHLGDSITQWTNCHSEDDNFKVGIEVQFDKEEEQKAIIGFWRLYFASIVYTADWNAYLPQLLGKKISDLQAKIDDDYFKRVKFLGTWMLNNTFPEGLNCFFRGKFQYQYSPFSFTFSCEIDKGGGHFIVDSSYNGSQMYFREIGQSRSQLTMAHLFKSEDNEVASSIGNYLIGGGDFPSDLPKMTANFLIEKASQGYYDHTNAQLNLQGISDYYLGDSHFELINPLNKLLDFPRGSIKNMTFSNVLKQIVVKSLMYFETKDIESKTIFETEPKKHSLEDALPLYLFRLKNGPQKDKETFNKIRDDFNTLAGTVGPYGFDVRVDISQNESQKDNSQQVQKNTTITIVGESDIALDLSGTGRAQMLMLSVLLNQSEDKVVFLDEPDLRIHPALQGKLSSMFNNVVSQLIIITHSSLILPFGSIRHVKRIYQVKNSRTRGSYSAVASGISDEFKDLEGIRFQDMDTLKKFEEKMIGNIRRANDYRFLFSNCTVLVEGPKEEICLPLWFNKWAKQQLEGKRKPIIDFPDLFFGVFFHSPEGKNNIALILKAAELFDVSCLALYDSDIFSNKTNKAEECLKAINALRGHSIITATIANEYERMVSEKFTEKKQEIDIVNSLLSYGLLKKNYSVKLKAAMQEGDALKVISLFKKMAGGGNLFVCGEKLSKKEFHSFDTHPLFKHFGLKDGDPVSAYYEIALKVANGDSDVPVKFLPFPEEFGELFRKIGKVCHIAE